jgi:hypothetical protein
LDDKKQRYTDLKETEDVLKAQLAELDEHIAKLAESLMEKSEIQSVILNLKKTTQSKEEECRRFYGTLTEKYEGDFILGFKHELMMI